MLVLLFVGLGVSACEKSREPAANEGERQDCKAWALAYGYAEQGLTFPWQDAALGISAHINFDLALGLSSRGGMRAQDGSGTSSPSAG